MQNVVVVYVVFVTYCQCITLSTITAFLESICTWLPIKKSELGMTPAQNIHVKCVNTEYKMSINIFKPK